MLLKISLAAALLIAGLCWGQDQYCPKAIHTKQALDGAAAGWTVSVRKTDHVLAGITFFDGPPEQEASLVYDSYSKGKVTDLAVWHFDRSLHIWISCVYQGTVVALSNALPENTTECKVTYAPGVHVDGYPEIKQVVCK